MKKVVFIILLFISILSIYAQDTNKKLLNKLVEKQILTETEANEIWSETTSSGEATLTFEEKVDKVKDAFNTPYMRFGGYGQLIYRYNDHLDIKHRLDARVIYLSMHGNLTKNLEYFILAEFVNPTINEFWAQWIPTKKLGFKIGQFNTPLSYENQLSSTTLETVLNTRSVSNLIGMGDDVQRMQNGKNNTGCDIGFMASGSLIPLADHDLLQYSVGMFQGSGIMTSEQNNSKDFAGALNFQPVKGFRIGSSIYFGEATYSATDGDAIEDHVRNRWLISTDYQSARLYCRAEWMHGKDGVIDREGLYGMAQYYLVPKKLNAAAKVDYYNKDKKQNEEVIDYTFALNYYFFPECRLQLNYTYSDYSNKWEDKKSDNIIVQMQIVF